MYERGANYDYKGYSELAKVNEKISRTCTANGTLEVGRELRAVISSNFHIQRLVNNVRYLRPTWKYPAVHI